MKPARTPPLKECAHLFEAVAREAWTLGTVLEAAGEADEETAYALLRSARALVDRIGGLADAAAAACGGDSMTDGVGAEAWLLAPDLLSALSDLRGPG